MKQIFRTPGFINRKELEMKEIKRISMTLCMGMLFLLMAAGCGKKADSWNSGNHTISSELTYEESMQLDYATEFAVDYYKDGFTLVSIADGSRFLLNT